MQASKRVLGGSLVLMLVAAGCGGSDSPPSDDGDSGAGTSTTAGQEPAGGDPTTTTAAPANGEGSNIAVVTIGDNRYEFDVEPGAIQRCDPDFFGAFWGLGASTDGSNNSFELLLPPEDDANFDDPPRVQVDDKVNDLDWRADPEFWQGYAELEGIPSQVDSWAIDGRRATGVATFIDANAGYAFIGGSGEEPTPVQGTFEIACAEE